MRALGTSRASVGLFLGEAAALSAAGSIIGAAAGWLLAHAAVRLTATTVNTLYVATAARVPALEWQDVVLSVSGGVVLSFFAAAAPALEASRVTPLAALRNADRLESRYRVRTRHVVTGVGLLLVAGSVFAVWVPLTSCQSSGLSPPWQSCSVWRSWCPWHCSPCRGPAATFSGNCLASKARWRTPTCRAPFPASPFRSRRWP